MRRIEEIANICANGKILQIIYDKMEDCLSYYFNTDEEMVEYINNNIDEVFNHFVQKKAKEVYVLNIASTENFAYFTDWEGMETLLSNQLKIFMPIIQQFIFYANIGKLNY